MKDNQAREFGAKLLNNQRTRFSVWSPDHDIIELVIVDQDRSFRLEKDADGFHVTEVDDCGAGQRYVYRIDNGPARPDPASRSQPDGVHGASEVIDCTFDWTDHDWRGVNKSDLVIYELHIGAFTDVGTFAAAIERLDELVELGVTAIELMPVAASAGRWNWGYDGVCLFAPLAAYGRPDDLRKLVDAAHSKGLAVVLDVVYNHLGPEGNYLSEFGPYLSKKHNTVWGAAPNFDDPQYASIVREFFIQAALIWFDEYHLDGLRVDAIHCMRDDSEPHIAVDISRAVRSWSQQTGQPALLIAESNVYDSNMLKPIDQGGVGFDAEWCDDFLHSVFAVLRPGEQLCHRKYENTDLRQVVEKGYVFEGSLREPDARQSPTERVDTTGLVYSIQHHDFIGNHPLGKRLHQLIGEDAQRAAAALLLLSPAIPMLFMGEEFCCEHPFQFFVDFGDEHLRRSVVEGRKREYPQHDWSAGILPTDPAAFADSKIGSSISGSQGMRNWYIELIRLRKSWKHSGLLCDQNLKVTVDAGKRVYVLQYRGGNEIATIAVRLSTKGEDDNSVAISDVVSDFQFGGLVLDSIPENTVVGRLKANHAQILFEKF